MRVIGVLVLTAALSLLPASAAHARQGEAVEWSAGLFAIQGGSTATDGVVRDAPQYGGLSIGAICCELTSSFDRVFRADLMRGSIRGALSASEPIRETVWRGEMRGTISPAGSEGTVVATETVLPGSPYQPRKFTGTWTWWGHPDQSVPHFIEIRFSGTLK